LIGGARQLGLAVRFDVSSTLLAISDEVIE
jgi:hypothetical protein